MPRISDKIPINNQILDRRIKLTKAQKQEIILLMKQHQERALKNICGEAISQRILARRFSVSRRTIQFVLDPSKQKQNLLRRQERGGWKQYYDKDSWKITMRNHRAYKNKLYKEGKI